MYLASIYWPDLKNLSALFLSRVTLTVNLKKKPRFKNVIKSINTCTCNGYCCPFVHVCLLCLYIWIQVFEYWIPLYSVVLFKDKITHNKRHFLVHMYTCIYVIDDRNCLNVSLSNGAETKVKDIQGEVHLNMCTSFHQQIEPLNWNECNFRIIV